MDFETFIVAVACGIVGGPIGAYLVHLFYTRRR